MTTSAELAAGDAEERLLAVEAIARRGELLAGEAAALQRLLADPSKRVQRRAAETLAAVAPAGDGAAEIDALLENALQSADRRMQWGAAYCQACRGRASQRTMAIWIEHLGSSDRDLRWAAHDLVVSHGKRLGSGAVRMVRRSAGAGGAQSRKMAIYCLRDLGDADTESETLVRAALAASEIEVGLAAAAAYPVVAPDRRAAAKVLCGHLAAADPRLRRAVAAALGKLAPLDDEARGALTAAARSADPGLRRAVLGALGGGDAEPGD